MKVKRSLSHKSRSRRSRSRKTRTQKRTTRKRTTRKRTTRKRTTRKRKTSVKRKRTKKGGEKQPCQGISRRNTCTMCYNYCTKAYPDAVQHCEASCEDVAANNLPMPLWIRQVMP